MQPMQDAHVKHLVPHDPLKAIEQVCASGESPPTEVIKEARTLLLDRDGWLDTADERKETFKLCTLVRMQWNSDDEMQRPADAAIRLLNDGHCETAQLLLGFVPTPKRSALLLQVLYAMLGTHEH